MWKRIHSDRDPRDTLWSELHKEFNAYFGIVARSFKGLLSRHPKYAFGLMVILLVVSLALSFTVFRAKITPNTGHLRVPVTNGISGLIAAGGRLQATIRLGNLVDSITAKPSLSAADSISLESALNQLDSLKRTP